MFRKSRTGEKFDFEKMKSEVREKYGITYDDTTLGVLDILKEHIEKLSQGREYELIKLMKEIEFLKTFAHTVKKEQEARDKLASGNIPFLIDFNSIMVQLKVYDDLSTEIIPHFNSIMVQLKVIVTASTAARNTNFNSIMVQLKDMLLLHYIMSLRISIP